MCTYCGTTNYRKIYQNHFGPIPVEEDGRTFEIHHIDGNHLNNDPSNLTAVTLQEHYNIHYNQGDTAACLLMAGQRMDLSVNELSKLSSKTQRKRVENGTHHFLDGSIQKKAAHRRIEEGTFHLLKRPDGTSLASDRVAAGTHHLLDGSIQKAITQKRLLENTHNFQKRADGSSLSADRVKQGTHNFLSDAAPSQIGWCCIKCRHSGKGTGNYTMHLNKFCKDI